MALSESVEESLKEAEGALRNALAYSARQEKPFIAKSIADMIYQLDNLIRTEELLDKLENRNPGDSGSFGPYYEE